MGWAANSPDLNPRRTLVGSARACCSCQSDQHNHAGWQMPVEDRDAIQQQRVTRLVTSRRCQAVVAVFGSSTRYWGSCLLDYYIVKLPVRLGSSDCNHPIHQTRVSGRISCLAEQIWQFFHGHNPHTPLCHSSHKCMFLTNVAPFKMEINKLSSWIRFIAKKHCYNKEIIYQHTNLLTVFINSATANCFIGKHSDAVVAGLPKLMTEKLR